jgi:hypothetical protein
VFRRDWLVDIVGVAAEIGVTAHVHGYRESYITMDGSTHDNDVKELGKKCVLAISSAENSKLSLTSLVDW